jgi:hypothetical protein
VFVVQRHQRQTEDFDAFPQMAEIGSAVILAGVALAVFDKWAKIRLIAGIFNIFTPLIGIKGAVASDASRADTIKGVDAVFDGREDIIRLADAQQVFRLVDWQLFVDPTDDITQAIFFDSAADAKAVKRQPAQVLTGLPPEIFVLSALDDSRSNSARQRSAQACVRRKEAT